MTISFDSVITETQKMPWGDECLTARFSDERLHGYSAIMVEDTQRGGIAGRLTTMIVRFPRCILSEVNTHRVFSRNSASSRARSIRSTIGAVMTDPYIPLFTKNHKGMGGGFLSDSEDIEATRNWLLARDSAVVSELRNLLGTRLPNDAKAEDWEKYVDDYYENVYHEESIPGVPSIHKQNANRLIEPFMWHEAIITSSFWENFFELRISDAAQPEIHALAILMKAILLEHSPVQSWIHIPFVETKKVKFDTWDELLPFMMQSASECARISYKDRSQSEKSKSSSLGERLLEMGHMSPFEHQAISLDKWERYLLQGDLEDDGNLHGNLAEGWVQCRHMVSEG